MSTQLDPNDVVTALKAVVTGLVDQGVQVDELTEKSIEADGETIVLAKDAAVLIFWGGEGLSDPQDNQATQYESRQPVMLLCGARNLRSSAEERTGARGLMGQVRKIAGRRLQLQDGTELPPIILQGADLFQFDKNGTWYAVNIMVSGLAQFEGEGEE